MQSVDLPTDVPCELVYELLLPLMTGRLRMWCIVVQLIAFALTLAFICFIYMLAVRSIPIKQHYMHGIHYELWVGMD